MANGVPPFSFVCNQMPFENNNRCGAPATHLIVVPGSFASQRYRCATHAESLIRMLSLHNKNYAVEELYHGDCTIPDIDI